MVVWVQLGSFVCVHVVQVFLMILGAVGLFCLLCSMLICGMRSCHVEVLCGPNHDLSILLVHVLSIAVCLVGMLGCIFCLFLFLCWCVYLWLLVMSGSMVNLIFN